MTFHSKFKGSLALAIIFSSSLYLSQGISAQENQTNLVDSNISSDFIKPDVSEGTSTDKGLSSLDEMESTTYQLKDPSETDSSESDNLSYTNEADFEFDEDSQLITGYTGEEKKVIVPPTINGVEVEGIDKRSFTRKGIESITLPESIKSIGDQAFAANKELSEISLNEGIEEIGQGAFLAAGESELILPDSMQEIGRLAFANNISLEKVSFNEGLKTIGQQAFSRDQSLDTEVSLPSTLEHLMTSAFDRTPVHTLKVLGDENSSKLVIHSGISEELEKIEIEDSRKPVSVLFNTRKNEGTVNVDLGQLDSTVKDAESLKDFLAEEIRVKYAAAYVNKDDSSGKSDLFYEKDLEWDLGEVDFTKNQLNLSTVPTIRREELQDKEGFITPSVENNSIVTQFNVVVNLLQPEWLASDFTYDTFEFKPRMKVPVTKLGISGFSQEGLKKLESNSDLEIPREMLKDQDDPNSGVIVEGILPNAFKDQSIKSVSFNQIDPNSDFIIGNSAFMNNEIETLKLSDGITVIDTGAFQHNQIREIKLPSSVWKVGNSAFLDNELSHLEFSEDVQKLQLDNYSFAHNNLEEVHLPYSIFKIRDYVFRGNPGVEPVDPKYLSNEDSQNTGEVKLYTLNPAHLSTSTYIATDTPFHKIILEAEGIDRDALYQVIESSNQVDDLDYRPDEYSSFMKVLDHSKTVFQNSEASQEEIDQAKNDLMDALGELRASSPNISKLRASIQKAEDLYSDLFTPESWAEVESALKNAKKVLADENKDNEKIQIAYEALNKEIYSLVISEAAKYNSADFIYEGSENGTKILGFSESGQAKFDHNKDLVLPDFDLEGNKITSIGKEAFRMPADKVKYGTDVVASPEGIKTLSLPSNLKTIENGAFRENNLSQVEFPSTLVSIGGQAFNANQLEALDIPDSVLEIGEGAFSLNKLSKVRLSKQLTEISNGIFSRNIYLKEINIPEGVTRIGNSAFIGAPLETLFIPTSVTEIGSRAFSSHRLTKLVIPGNVVTIGNAAFAQNVKYRTLTEVIFEEGIKSIKNAAFKSALIETADLPTSLEALGERAFVDQLNAMKENIIVKLYTSVKDHLAFNTERSLKNQEVIFKKAEPESPETEEPNVGNEGINGEENRHEEAKNDEEANPNKEENHHEEAKNDEEVSGETKVHDPAKLDPQGVIISEANESEKPQSEEEENSQDDVDFSSDGLSIDNNSKPVKQSADKENKHSLESEDSLNPENSIRDFDMVDPALEGLPQTGESTSFMMILLAEIFAILGVILVGTKNKEN